MSKDLNLFSKIHPPMVTAWQKYDELIRKIHFSHSPFLPQQNCPRASESRMWFIFSFCLSKEAPLLTSAEGRLLSDYVFRLHKRRLSCVEWKLGTKPVRGEWRSHCLPANANHSHSPPGLLSVCSDGSLQKISAWARRLTEARRREQRFFLLCRNPTENSQAQAMPMWINHIYSYFVPSPDHNT